MPELKKEGTIEERPYQNDMKIAYELNADCDTVAIDVTYFHVEDISDDVVYDGLKIGETEYYGKMDPFKV